MSSYITKSKARYQIVLIKSRERSPYDGYSLLIWVWSVSHCMQAPVVEGQFPCPFIGLREIDSNNQI
uniref:Uncharacterized protein n=1 Tax=Arundo donax TaxID=35708 RepID=A0A0A9ECN8_ARUDO